MELYFSPMACSLASRISLYEAGAKDVQFVEVDSKTKRTVAGANYFEIYPLGLVPFLRLEDGSGLSENAAILQYIAPATPVRNSHRGTKRSARNCSSGSVSSAPNCTRACSSRCSIKRRPKARARTC